MKDIKITAGTLIIARGTGRVLLLLRNAESKHPHTWSMVAGHLKEGEDIITGMKREINEELSINPDIIEFYYNGKVDNGFHYFIGFVDNEFECNLDDENLNWGWFERNDLPTPLYPDLQSKIDSL